MISKDEKQRLSGIISETITLLCKSRLFQKFKEEFYIEGLIGITLDQQELMMVSIHQKIYNDVTEEDTSSVEKDDPGKEGTVGNSGKKRKKPCESGPKEKTAKVEKEIHKPLKEHIASHVESNYNPDSKPLHPVPDLHSGYFPSTNSPSHLERLNNFYMLSAGYANAFSAYNAGATVTSPSNHIGPGAALNLAVDSKSSPVLHGSSSGGRRKMTAVHPQQEIGQVKEELKTVIKTEDSSQPNPLVVQPVPVTAFPMYSSPVRKQQPVFNEPLLVPQVKSPTVAQPAGHHQQRDSKLTEILDKIRTNIEGRDDGSQRRSVFDHIAHNVVRTEGQFITSRMIGRKTGRKAVAIREVFLKLSTPVDDINHIGQAKEISRGTLVYYKCPPSMIKEEALANYGLDLEMYKVLYASEMKTPPSQHMLSIVEGHSPYFTALRDGRCKGFEEPSDFVVETAKCYSKNIPDDYSHFESLPNGVDGSESTSATGKSNMNEPPVDEAHFKLHGNGNHDEDHAPGLNSDVLLGHDRKEKGVDPLAGEESMDREINFNSRYGEANGLRYSTGTEPHGLPSEFQGEEDDLDSSGSDKLTMDEGLTHADDEVEHESDYVDDVEELRIRNAETVAADEEDTGGSEGRFDGVGQLPSGLGQLRRHELGGFTPLAGLEKLVSEPGTFG